MGGKVTELFGKTHDKSRIIDKNAEIAQAAFSRFDFCRSAMIELKTAKITFYF